MEDELLGHLIGGVVDNTTERRRGRLVRQASTAASEADDGEDDEEDGQGQDGDEDGACHGHDLS